MKLRLCLYINHQPFIAFIEPAVPTEASALQMHFILPCCSGRVLFIISDRCSCTSVKHN